MEKVSIEEKEVLKYDEYIFDKICLCLGVKADTVKESRKKMFYTILYDLLIASKLDKNVNKDDFEQFLGDEALPCSLRYYMKDLEDKFIFEYAKQK